MRLLSFIMVCVMAVPASAEWTPPEKPDPQAILQEAQADADAKRYADALAKHVWFHEHALEHQPSMSGVRLSFALGSWVRLGDRYPAALEKLEAVRDAAADAVLESKLRKTNELFYDFAAINRELEEEARTTELFVELDKDYPEKAEKVFSTALPALLKAKDYKLCGKYLSPKTSIEQYTRMFHDHEKMAKDPRFANSDLRDFGHKKFTNDVTILVALLVVNERQPEAGEVADRAKKEWADVEFQAAVDKALTGEMPKPWP